MQKCTVSPSQVHPDKNTSWTSSIFDCVLPYLKFVHHGKMGRWTGSGLAHSLNAINSRAKIF